MAIVSFRAATAISAGQPVTVASGGTIYPSSAADAVNARSVGIALDTATVGGLVRVDKDKIQHIFTGQIAGSIPYLSLVSGGIQPTYSAFQSEANASALSIVYAAPLGRAVSSSGINIELSQPVMVYTPI